MFNLKKREEVEVNKMNMLVEMHIEEKEIANTEFLVKKIESAILELDDTIMLFCEF